LEETKTRAEPNAQSRPTRSEPEKCEEQASMTPSVSGKSEMYVLVEYETPNNRA
jgi:hypothetical protein